MQIVIDIDEELKHSINAKGLFLNPHEKISLIDAINNGTPLPKGHGRLIDADKTAKTMKNIMCGTSYEGRAVNVLINEIDTPTVLEAYMRGDTDADSN